MPEQKAPQRCDRMRRRADDLFWSFYATCYDNLLRLHGYRQLYHRIREIIALGSRHKVLDAGCGTGNLEMLACSELAGSRVWGLDRCAAMLRRARRKVRAPQVFFEAADINQPLPFPDSSLDLVVSVNSLYALSRPREVIQEFARCLQTGGRCLVTNPRPGFSSMSLLLQHVSQIRSLGGVLELLALVPATVVVLLLNVVITLRLKSGEFAWTSPEDIETWLREAGLDPRVVEPAYGDQNVLVLAVKPE